MTAALAPGSALVATTNKPASGGSTTILLFVVIGAAFYFLIYRPQQKKQRAAREASNAFEVGDEVVTAGGIVGRVLDIDDDRVTLETSVGASFVVLRPYVLRKLVPAEPPSDVVDGDEHDEHDGADGHGQDHPPEPPEGPPEELGGGASDGGKASGTSKDPGRPTTPPPTDGPEGPGLFGPDETPEG